MEIPNCTFAGTNCRRLTTRKVWYPQYNASWPSGYQWVVGGDWTGEEYDPSTNGLDTGQYESGWVVAMGMGNPLQAGTYYVGVVNTSGSTPMSYSLSSRGIGTNFTDSGDAARLQQRADHYQLEPGGAPNAAYYSVVVPSNMPSWRVELDTNIGDVLLVIQENALPNSARGAIRRMILTVDMR